MKKFYVIGDPIAQSKSPTMHTAAFRDLGIAATFEAVHVKPDELEDWVTMFRSSGTGACITIPHKVSIMPFLDEIDPFACRVGAVNTIVNHSGRLTGFNTDGPGFYSSIRHHEPTKRNILILGSGGAAKGIYHALKENNCLQVTMANRTVAHAKALCEHVITMEEAMRRLSEFNMIINTTPVGMFPNVEVMPLDLINLGKHCVVCDIIYNPEQTKLLQEAAKRGAEVSNGVGMFVNQGAIAFQHWTGQMPNVEIMRQAVVDSLRNS